MILFRLYSQFYGHIVIQLHNIFSIIKRNLVVWEVLFSGTFLKLNCLVLKSTLVSHVLLFLI